MQQLTDRFIQKYRDEHDGKKPSFLWQLKLSDNDYAELKDNVRQNFRYVEKDVALYYAEWWRREFNGGHARIEDVCCSAGLNESYSNSFYEAAKTGARLLGVQTIRTKGADREVNLYKYSLFYQGGLPMNFIAADAKDVSGWHTFFRNMAWKSQDFSVLSESDGRASLSLSESIHCFCDVLQHSAEYNQPNNLPFHFNIEWWKVIKKEIDLGIQEGKSRNPFALKWEIKLDDIDKTMKLGFRVDGPQILPESFRRAHHLDGRQFTSLSLRVNDKSETFAEFDSRFYSRRALCKVCSSYHPGDVISLCINETGEILWQRWLDFSDPKLVSLAERVNNIFCLCDSADLARKDCRVIAAPDWSCQDANRETYLYDGNEYSVFKFAAPTEKVHLISQITQQSKNICYDSPVIWTGIYSSCRLKTEVPVLEEIYDAPDGVNFIECKGEKETKATKVLYADANCHNWKSTPSYGLIRAQVCANGESVDPVRFINTGRINIKCIKSSKDECIIRFEWPNGTIFSDEAIQDGNSWLIRKDKLSDQRYAKFRLSPRNGEEFILHIIPPFNDFCIYDKNGKIVANHSLIPLVDLDSYRYYLHMDVSDNLVLYPDRIDADLKYNYTPDAATNGNTVKKHYFNDPVIENKINKEGGLSSLFIGGSDQIYGQLEQSMGSLPETKATIAVKHGNDNLDFQFKEFPYQLEYNNGIITIPSENRLPKYEGSLLALPIENPEHSPITLKEDGNQYSIPDEIICCGYDKWLVFGSLRGYVLPILIDLSNSCLCKEERDERRRMHLEALSNELCSAPCFAPIWQRAITWFNLLSHGQIPGSSILELVAISEDRTLLTKFAIQLALCSLDDNEKMETLRLSLLDFQRQMSILWTWSSEINNDDIKSFIISGNGEIINSHLRGYYNQWVISSKKDNAEELICYLQDMDGHASECYDKLINELMLWFKFSLKDNCEPDKEYINPDTNAYRSTQFEGVPSDEAQKAFISLRQSLGNIRGDELWKKERLKFNDILKTTNLSDYLDKLGINHNEGIRREIRKSIIYGLKFKNDDEI